MEEKILPIGNVSDPNHLGNLVRQQRKLANLTQFELASLSFVGTRFVSELENGKSTLEIGKVLQVIKTLGLELHLSSTPTALASPEHHPTQKSGYRPLAPHHIEQFIQQKQTRVPIFKKNEAIFLPDAQSKSSHILKLALFPFKSMVPNELFCTLLARALNFSVPNVELLPPHENILLLEEQPKTSSSRALQQKENIERVIFHYLIGNYHVDAKNNLLCTMVYPDFSLTKPCEISGKSHHEILRKEHWIQFAEKNKIKVRFLMDKVKELSENILQEAENVFEMIDKNFKIDIDVIHKICEIIERRATEQRI